MARPPTARRQRRIADQIQQEVSLLLLRGLKDQRIAPMTTVTGVRVSPDYKFATVLVSVLGSEPQQRSTLIALKNAAGHIQGQLAKTLKLRHTPHLRFQFDDRIAEGDRVLGIMAQLHQEREAAPPSADAPAPPESTPPHAG